MIKHIYPIGMFWIMTILGACNDNATSPPPISLKNTQEAIFAGGCFWCMEEAFADVQGVVATSSGFCGGTAPNPTYKSHPGYLESVKVTFDPQKISYEQLLTIFWRNIDPFDDQGQFCDKGSSYKAVIFYLNDDQKHKAEASKAKVEKVLHKMVVTTIQPVTQYVQAEDYHQHYAKKNPIRYRFYRSRCGRDDRLNEIWREISTF